MGRREFLRLLALLAAALGGWRVGVVAGPEYRVYLPLVVVRAPAAWRVGVVGVSEVGMTTRVGY